MSYLFAITFSLCVAYGLLLFILPIFFRQTGRQIGVRSITSLVLIMGLSIAGYLIVFNIRDQELGNRILHAFGGGFMMFLVYFLAIRDRQLKTTKLQFIILGFLLVSTAGVANEILEFSLQNYYNFIFAANINDTWYDLISNSIGALVGAGALVSFVNTNSS